MRLNWLSNFASHSGYANQARLFVPRIQQSGHPITVIDIAGGQHMPQVIHGVEVLPVWGDPLGRDSAITSHYSHTRAHALVSLIDTWVYGGAGMDRVNWFPWTPIHEHPVTNKTIAALKDAKRPIAMSQFGVDMLKRAGFDPMYVPLAYDPNVWKPGDKQQARAKLGWQNEPFIVSFVGVNDSCPSRKGIFELIAAWSMFCEGKQDVRLYLHTSATGQVAGDFGGIHIPDLLKMLEINPDTIIWVNQPQYLTHIPQSHLVSVAQASDVLCAPSRGEGFGLAPLEFQACGCPVIGTRFSAQVELTFDGWFVEYEPELNPQGSIWAKPGIASLVDALEAAYAERGNSKRSANAIQRAQEYTIENVFHRYMKPVLTEIAETVLELA